MSMTREQLQARLDAYLAAELKILESQEYRVGDGSTARSNKRAELASVQAEIAKISSQIAGLDAAANGTRRIVRFIPGR